MKDHIIETSARMMSQATLEEWQQFIRSLGGDAATTLKQALDSLSGAIERHRYSVGETNT